jgi:DNA polymerase sigma
MGQSLLPTCRIDYKSDKISFFSVDIFLFWCYNYYEVIAMENQKDISVIKQLIHRVIPYKKEIFFFGSRASGNYDQASDYDMLIIVHQSNMDRRILIGFQTKIKRLCAKTGLDADVIVRDIAHTEAMKKFPGNIIHAALQTGVLI